MEHKIGLVYFAPDESADNCMKGLFDGLKEQGIEERVNLEVRRSHAQAEIANIPLLIRNYDGSDVNVIVAMTTPVLTAAASMARSKPVVFTYVYDPIAAGAGKSQTDHLPNVTGVSSFPPVQETVDDIATWLESGGEAELDEWRSEHRPAKMSAEREEALFRLLC